VITLAPMAKRAKAAGRYAGMGAASALTIGRCCRQVPMAISTLGTASEAPTISPETVPHSIHQHLSSEFDS